MIDNDQIRNLDLKYELRREGRVVVGFIVKFVGGTEKGDNS